MALDIRKALKGMVSLSAASVIRAMRLGPGAGKKSLEDTYHAVDPFSWLERMPERTMLRRIPEARLGDIVAWPEKIVLDPRYIDVSGSTPLDDIVAILALAIAQRPRAVLEFGTFWGSATFNLAQNLPEATIHTIDLPPENSAAQALIEGRPVDDLHLIASRELGKAFRGTPEGQRVVQHFGDTAAYDYSVIPDELSFFLVDGSHTYEYAKSDTLRAFALARGHATIAWHDCDASHPGVTRWLGELLDAGLPVQRVAGTVVACLKFSGEDERLKRWVDSSG